MNTELILIILVVILAVWLVSKIPSILTVAFLLFIIYAIELGSHGSIPLMTDFLRGVQILISKG